ncbi:MAG: phosphotransferase family protein [Acidimicrobiia bacterium]
MTEKQTSTTKQPLDGQMDGAQLAAGDWSEALASAAGNGWKVRQRSGTVLQASRHRPVVSYRVSYEEAGSTTSTLKIVIGKAYYRGDGAGTFEVMQRLWAEGFSDENCLCITEPIAWVPERKLLLQGEASGQPLYDHLPVPERGIARVRDAGRWLAKLHTTDAGSASVPLPARFETNKLTTYATGLAEAHPELGDRVRSVAEAAAAALEASEEDVQVLTHGDFQPKNIYVARHRTTVIDFDRHALAPPARDLAHFLGQCLTMSWVRAGSFERIAPWNAAFLAAYGATGGNAPASLPAYLARTFLEVLYYKLVVKPVADPRFAPAWLDQCERWMTGELLQETPGAT